MILFYVLSNSTQILFIYLKKQYIAPRKCIISSLIVEGIQQDFGLNQRPGSSPLFLGLIVSGGTI